MDKFAPVKIVDSVFQYGSKFEDTTIMIRFHDMSKNIGDAWMRIKQQNDYGFWIVSHVISNDGWHTVIMEKKEALANGGRDVVE